jgi:uncharacterized membrane protein
MQSMLNDESGIKFTVGGFATWFISLLNNIDVTQMLGFVGLVIGLVIQIASFIRNKKADDRAKLQHDLQMRVLQKELSGE